MKLLKEIFKVNEKEFTKIETVGGNLYLKRYFREPTGNIAVEDFAPGDVLTWGYWCDEFHYVIKGKAEMIFSMPPFHQKAEKAIAEEGDAYMIYRGEHITFKVVSEEPYRHLCVIMPAIPVPSGDHLVLDQMQKSVFPRVFSYKKNKGRKRT